MAMEGGGAAIDATLPPDARAQTCFLDRDKDGVGAGSPVDCDDITLVNTLGSSLSPLGGDCDDNNAQRSPNLTDLCGDAIDNDAMESQTMSRTTHVADLVPPS
jgi:hypothetical protein